MEILVNLDVMMAKRKISAGELAERVGITPANLSILKNNKAKAIRFSTLMALGAHYPAAEGAGTPGRPALRHTIARFQHGSGYQDSQRI